MQKIVEIRPFHKKSISKPAIIQSNQSRRVLSCPGCSKSLQVSEYRCPTCEISVRGQFPSNPFLDLSPEQQDLLREFLLSGGNLKELAGKMGCSYPTLRKQLDRLIAAVRRSGEVGSPLVEKRKTVVRMVKDGELKAEAAEKIINELL